MKPKALHTVTDHFTTSATLPQRFFEENADEIARACWDMARRFHQGGRLIAFGNGPWASDAQHMSVEFVHPVIMGKRALPAMALTNDSVLLNDQTQDGSGPDFSRQLRALARPTDIAAGISGNGDDANILAALSAVKQKGLMTVGLCAGDGGLMFGLGLDYCFVAPGDPLHAQEIHETLYHVLWELVHVFFEYEGLLR